MVAALICVVVGGGVLLWPGSDEAPTAPTSQQIKASAQARLDASTDAGRVARANLKATAKTPSEETCQAAWDNLLPSEQKPLLRGTWMHACVDPAAP